MIEFFNLALIHGRILFRFKHLHSVHKVCPLLHKELTLIDKLLQLLHSLAWQLADHAGRELIFDDGNLSPSRRKQTGFVERLIGSIMNPAFRETLYDFFRHELEQLDRLGSNLSIDEYFTFRRSITDYTLAGETVKSNGEKIIADFNTRERRYGKN